MSVPLKTQVLPQWNYMYSMPNYVRQETRKMIAAGVVGRKLTPEEMRKVCAIINKIDIEGIQKQFERPPKLSELPVPSQQTVAKTRNIGKTCLFSALPSRLYPEIFQFLKYSDLKAVFQAGLMPSLTEQEIGEVNNGILNKVAQHLRIAKANDGMEIFRRQLYQSVCSKVFESGIRGIFTDPEAQEISVYMYNRIMACMSSVEFSQLPVQKKNSENGKVDEIKRRLFGLVNFINSMGLFPKVKKTDHVQVEKLELKDQGVLKMIESLDQSVSFKSALVYVVHLLKTSDEFSLPLIREVYGTVFGLIRQTGDRSDFLPALLNSITLADEKIFENIFNEFSLIDDDTVDTLSHFFTALINNQQDVIDLLTPNSKKIKQYGYFSRILHLLLSQPKRLRPNHVNSMAFFINSYHTSYHRNYVQIEGRDLVTLSRVMNQQNKKFYQLVERAIGDGHFYKELKKSYLSKFDRKSTLSHIIESRKERVRQRKPLEPVAFFNESFVFRSMLYDILSTAHKEGEKEYYLMPLVLKQVIDEGNLDAFLHILSFCGDAIPHMLSHSYELQQLQVKQKVSSSPTCFSAILPSFCLFSSAQEKPKAPTNYLTVKEILRRAYQLIKMERNHNLKVQRKELFELLVTNFTENPISQKEAQEFLIESHISITNT